MNALNIFVELVSGELHNHSIRHPYIQSIGAGSGTIDTMFTRTLTQLKSKLSTPYHPCSRQCRALWILSWLV